VSHGIQRVVDIRRFPASRRYPHFNSDQLAAKLAGHGIAYTWLESLGGRRSAAPDSTNTAWRNAAFRGYADYMSSEAFTRGMEELDRRASASRVAIMCSESVWWRCHRALVADLLKSRGTTVLHILDAGRADEHPYTPAARLADGRLTYDPARGEPASRLQLPATQTSLL
jgi:uncharacterized protein (DUF488 family)